jgi:hypothetical protein
MAAEMLAEIQLFHSYLQNRSYLQERKGNVSQVAIGSCAILWAMLPQDILT